MKDYNRRLLVITLGVAILVTLATALVFSKVGDYRPEEKQAATPQNAATIPAPQPVPVPLPPLPANASFPETGDEITKFGEPMLDASPVFGNPSSSQSASGTPNGNFFPAANAEGDNYEGEEDRSDEYQDDYGR